jgi:hypothetical protein
MFRTKIAEKIETQILFSIPPPPKIVSLMRQCEKYCRAGQTTDDNMAHAYCMLDT